MTRQSSLSLILTMEFLAHIGGETAADFRIARYPFKKAPEWVA